MDAGTAFDAVAAAVDGDLSDPDRQASSDATHVFLADLDGRPVAVKTAATDDGVRRVRTETAVVDYVAGRVDVPVPRLLASDPSDDGAGPYLVTTACEGRDVEALYESLPPTGRERLLERVGRLLGRLHGPLGLDDHGRLRGTDAETLRVESRPWPAYLRDDLLAEYRERLSGTAFESLAETVAERFEEFADDLADPPRPTVLHTDVGPWNLYVRDWDDDPDPETPVTCLFDWDRAVAGPAEYDVFRAAYRFPLDPGTTGGRLPDRTDALYDAYRSVRGLPDGFERRRRAYRCVLELGQCCHFDAIADERDASRDELARRMRAAVREPLEGPR